MSGFAARDLDQPMTVVLREMPTDFDGQATITVCVNVRPDNAISVSCGPRGGHAIETAIRAEVVKQSVPVDIRTIECLGLCQKGPNVRLAPGNSWFHGVREADVPELVDLVLAHISDQTATA